MNYNLHTSNVFGDINDTLGKVVNRKQSLSDALDMYCQISKEYSDPEDIEEYHYSSHNFLECTKEEKQCFYDDQLQFIQCLVITSIYDKKGVVWNWGEILKLMINNDYAKVKKENRKAFCPTSSTNRPIGESSYDIWNGFQVIDLDIKNKELAEKLKPVIFNELCKYHWFLGTSLSSSGKSLHVWTKIDTVSIVSDNKKVEFQCNFRHKFSYVYIALLLHAKEYGYTKDDIFTYMDMAMAKPQQVTFISSDREFMMNTGFISERLDKQFSGAYENGIESINWISHPDLVPLFSKLEWFISESNNNKVEVQNIEDLGERDINVCSGKKHYKHQQRWQLANTLTYIYGEEKALKYMCEICDGTNRKELKGDVRTAAIHNKPVSLWAIRELNDNHGFKIKVKTNEDYQKIIGDKEVSGEDTGTQEEHKEGIQGNRLEDPIKALNANANPEVLRLSHNQYLSDIKDDILGRLTHITLLEAGAGYGKTEMIKSLPDKVLLILPFTSTIQAKIEASEVTQDWGYYYGNKRPTIEDLVHGGSVSMTIDKFANMNIMELDQADFKYIVIDESHLLFTSSYRDVMAPAIQRLANCRAKVIMMSGTPTGELLFFPNITYIKVIKEDLRHKEFNIHLCHSKNEQLVEMCKDMANDIMNGIKILYPTNKGTLWTNQVEGLVQRFLTEYHWEKPLNASYYKKANFKDKAMENINKNKTIGDKDIIFCTNFLSVGIDICDRYQFRVYFNETWIPQDIEQFANRIRNNDLYIKMYLPKVDSDEMPINYSMVSPLDLSINKQELMLVRDLIRTCNDMLERNNDEAKYNPIISSIISTNTYLRYDEVQGHFYIDETQYKLHVFEERYSKFSKQFKVLVQGMKNYGYTIGIEDHPEELSEDAILSLEQYIYNTKKDRYDYCTAQTFKFLDSLDDDTMELYREVIRGNYNVLKSDKESVDVVGSRIYTEDVEIIEKNIPIVVSLYKNYDCKTIKEIYEFCLDKKSNKINYNKLDKIRRFILIEYNRKKDRLDFPVMRCIKDINDYINKNPVLTKEDITNWQQKNAVKYANSIKDVVVDDVQFLKMIYEHTVRLWKVVVLESNPKDGKIMCEPFRLLWEKKHNVLNIYDESTSQFFVDMLEDNMKEVEVPIPEMPHTSKKKMEEVSDEIDNAITKSFEYETYSKEDGSNDRFMRRQENTYSRIRKEIKEATENKIDIRKSEEGLFESEEEVPF